MQTHPHRQQRQKEGRNLTKPEERFGEEATGLGDGSNLEFFNTHSLMDSSDRHTLTDSSDRKWEDT
jgi:hypothetical protein